MRQKQERPGSWTGALNWRGASTGPAAHASPGEQEQSPHGQPTLNS